MRLAVLSLLALLIAAPFTPAPASAANRTHEGPQACRAEAAGPDASAPVSFSSQRRAGRPAFRPGRPGFRPGAGPGFRPNRPGFRPGRPGRPVVLPSFPDRPGFRPNRPGFRPGYRPGRPAIRRWIRRAHYGRVVAGVVLGTIITVAIIGQEPPQRGDLCWYWVSPARDRGYWDYCY